MWGSVQGAEWMVIRGHLHQKVVSVQKRTEGTEVLWMKMGEVTLGHLRLREQHKPKYEGDKKQVCLENGRKHGCLRDE